MLRKIWNIAIGLPGRLIEAVRGRVRLSLWRRRLRVALRARNTPKATEARRELHRRNVCEFGSVFASTNWGGRKYPPEKLDIRAEPLPEELKRDFSDFTQPS
jgi:hypothetical protein